MSRLWRISAYPDLKGIGATLSDGRWHTKGKPLVYLGFTTAGSCLEYLAHVLEGKFLPINLRWIEAYYLEAVSRKVVTESDLPEGWSEDLNVTREIGNRWLFSGKSALLEVPSVIVPDARNCLLNPSHRDAQKVQAWVHDFFFDSRIKQLVENAFSFQNLPAVKPASDPALERLLTYKPVAPSEPARTIMVDPPGPPGES